VFPNPFATPPPILVGASRLFGDLPYGPPAKNKGLGADMGDAR
jgi:hypothetical protein